MTTTTPTAATKQAGATLSSRAGDAADEARGVLVVDPYPAMRRALRSARARGRHWVAGEAADMLTALRSSPDARIAVALVDSRLAGLQSVALDALRSLARRVRLVVMGTGDAELYAAPYVEAGASGYWAKDGDLTALVAPATGGRRSASGRCG